MGYLSNFIVYMLAMIGVMVVALILYKQATAVSSNKNSKNMKILDSLSLGQRKTLYVVSVKDEEFLIAADSDRTSLISKLECGKECNVNISDVYKTQKSHSHKAMSNFTTETNDKYNSLIKHISLK